MIRGLTSAGHVRNSPSDYGLELTGNGEAFNNEPLERKGFLLAELLGHAARRFGRLITRGRVFAANFEEAVAATEAEVEGGAAALEVYREWYTSLHDMTGSSFPRRRFRFRWEH